MYSNLTFANYFNNRFIIRALFCLSTIFSISHAYADNFNTGPDEEILRINHHADKLEAKIKLSNLVYDDKKLTTYVNSIMRNLYPQLADIFRVKLYVSTEINAFVLPNGSVYLNLGMLAKAENEAQIAAILAHEGAHYIANHQLHKQQELKYLTSGADFFGYARTRSLISDYSKELEQEADNMGFDSLVNARYDTSQAAQIFSLIAEQTKALNIQKPSLYSTHPKLIDRINYYHKLSDSLGQISQGYIGEKTYQDHTATIFIYTLQLNLSKFNFQNIILNLENNTKMLEKHPQTWFYLAEAYRQRSEENDIQFSDAAYLQSIKALPAFAPSFRALGISYMKNHKPVAALSHFKTYLKLAPHAQGRRYIELYIKQLSQSSIK